MQTLPTKGFSRVECDPTIQGGEPVVRGTRVTVRSVVLAEREWGGVDGVRSAYPGLAAEDVADALAYYEARQDAIDGYMRDYADA
jgi:uncharacterized protein (DUF433 family)